MPIPSPLCLALLALPVPQEPAEPPAPAWRPLATGSDELLTGLCFLDARRGFAVGGDRERGTPAVLLRTTDGGERWERVDTGLEARLYAVDFATPERGVAVGLGGTLLSTDDGGASWEAVDVGTRAWLASVHFPTAREGFVVGTGTLLVTRDGGASWREASDALPAAARSRSLRDVRFLDATTGFVAGDDGLLLATRDGGRRWEAVPTGVDTWLRALSFVDARTGFVAAADGVLLGTADGGVSWRPLAGRLHEKLNDLVFLDARRGFVTTMQGRLYGTRDGGATWTLEHDTAPLALTALARVAGAPGEPAALLAAAGDGGAVLLRAAVR